MITAAGIIAAGAGTRLQKAGARTLKPLIPVRGKPLADWVASGLRSAGIRRIVMLLNSSGGPVREYLESRFPDVSWVFLTQDTASSWESFRIVSLRLAQETDRFLISAVDSLIRPPDVARFRREAGGADAALALTRFVEDEKPLWADTDASGRVTALGEAARGRQAVTCGLYALTRGIAERFPPVDRHARLRDFLRALAAEESVLGVTLRDAVDLDRPEDLPAAEKVTLCFDA